MVSGRSDVQAVMGEQGKSGHPREGWLRKVYQRFDAYMSTGLTSRTTATSRKGYRSLAFDDKVSLMNVPGN